MTAISVHYFENTYPDYSAGQDWMIDYEVIRADILANVFRGAQKQQHLHKGCDGGVYVGTIGNAYTLYYLSKKMRFSRKSNNLASTALELVKHVIKQTAKMKKDEQVDEYSFFDGKIGMYAVCAWLLHETGNVENAKEYIDSYIAASGFHIEEAGNDLFIGRAGYLCGALWLNHRLKPNTISEEILHKICIAIIESGKAYSIKTKSKCPLMYTFNDSEYFGAKHGLSSILFMLLKCESFLKSNAEAENLIKASVDYLLSLQMDDGNFPVADNDVVVNTGQNELVQWCHGAPGMIYLIMKSYTKWRDSRYLESAKKIGELVWAKGLSRNGPGLCHGIAGNGYVFLMLYKLTGCTEVKYLHRANEFAKFIKTEKFKQAKIPDHPFSLFEGFAGTLCFLADLMEPETATFPFMELF